MTTCFQYVYQCLEENKVLKLRFCLYAVKDSDECELYCVAKGFRFFRQLSPRVKDGTPCLSDLNKVCIGGTCKVCTILISSTRRNQGIG